MSSAGDIEIKVCSNWAKIHHRGYEKFYIPLSELRDLRYAADKAMREARFESMHDEYRDNI